MDDELALRYDSLSQSHFWLTSKTYVIEKFLASHLKKREPPKRMLEVGCCAGNFLKSYLSQCQDVHGLDMSHGALMRCREQHSGIRVTRADGFRLPYREASFDLVLMQDVLEHIVDDSGTVRGLNRVLRKGGLCFVCVPAYMFLFGHHDRVYGHLRRYTRPELRSRLEENGFRVVRATYFQSPFLLPLYVKRRLGGSDGGDDFIVPPRPVNTFFDRMLRMEALPMRLIDLPFGPTLMCLAEKTADVAASTPSEREV